MKLTVAPSPGGRWAVAYVAPGVVAPTGILDCPTYEIACREARDLGHVPTTEERVVRRKFDGDQSLLFE